MTAGRLDSPVVADSATGGDGCVATAEARDEGHALDAVTGADGRGEPSYRENIRRGREFEQSERVRFGEQWREAISDRRSEQSASLGRYDAHADQDVAVDRRGRIDNLAYDHETETMIINEVKATDWSRYEHSANGNSDADKAWQRRADDIRRQVDRYTYGALTDLPDGGSVQPYVTFDQRPVSPETGSVDNGFAGSIEARFAEYGIHVEWAEDNPR
jgi:hypothetical protein